MKQVIVGIYEAGYEQIELVLREGQGGEFYYAPELKKNKLPRIKIGADHDKWKSIIETLLHEIDEYIATRMRLRYQVSLDIANDASAYIFVMDHIQLAEKCARVAEFLVEAVPDLQSIWKKWKKNEKKKQQNP